MDIETIFKDLDVFIDDFFDKIEEITVDLKDNEVDKK